MLSAKEARQLVEASEAERQERVKSDIEKIITDAVKSCKNAIYLRFHFSNNIVEWLKSLGYDVKELYDVKRGTITIVRW